ncbi:TIGR01777 family oxidoreductase [uncultured Thermanaerothrix sp.]|uniref:TIGR01777 family oxidoreductase n=1 Tax=uncultured Thermanaerothrix sp. TaxID=1195149 RepID=UPI00263810D9|nr:TIGR01777 family oxidoreductase [uncultured Thermanaerothrix sp.]
MNIMIIGGSGFIGRALITRLLEEGHTISVLSRRPQSVHLPVSVAVHPWDGHHGTPWANLLAEMDAVVNLAGANLGVGRWTQQRKMEFLTSRVVSGKAVVEAFALAPRKPRLLVQASAIGYYGSCGDEVITEASPPGQDFLAQLCVQWEASTQPVEAWGVRRVLLRTGIVLDRESLVLKRLLLPFRLGVGGPLGSGRQWMPWIHMADQIGAMLFLLHNEQATGPFNLTAPNPVPNAVFGRTLARVLRRPYWLPVPAFVLRWVLGEMSTLVLDGQRALPQRLLNLGYRFVFEDLEAALRDLLTR